MEAEVITAVQHHDEQRMSDDQRDTSNMGRPRLVEDQDTVPIRFLAPESLRNASNDLARGQRSKALRTFLEAYLALDPDKRWHLHDPVVLRAALESAAAVAAALDN